MSRLEVLHETKSKTGRGFSYNFYIYPKKKWYIRIIPRFVYRAGFELGTGLSVNVTDPMEAAAALRTADIAEAVNNIHSVKQAQEIIEEKQDEIDQLKNKLEELGNT